jgi:hypothetical protein
MEGMGDFYAIVLHDDQLRAGLAAMHHDNRAGRSTWTRAARSSVAAALRAFATLVDVPRPSVPAERLPEAAG